MTNRAVFDHTFGFWVSWSSTIETNHCPFVGDAEGCSSKPNGGMIQDTLGNLPLLTSTAKSFGNVCLNAFSNSGVPGCRNALKYGSTLSVRRTLVVTVGS